MFVCFHLRSSICVFLPMPKPRSKSPSAGLPANPARGAIIDSGFVPARAKLIDVAAFLDRAERYAIADDFRCAALREAAGLLVDGKPERARRILEKLSDPTTTPEEKSSGKAALGAWKAAVTTKAAAHRARGGRAKK
jgi:hypothetical protein